MSREGVRVLEPNSMRVLHDALRPPAGYELDHLVITTFTLDLVSLMSIPLAFTWFGAHGDTDTAAQEPLQLLAALAQYTDRITVFHQGGAVNVPDGQQPLLRLVEDVLVPVPAKRTRGIFHPKLWLASYTGDQAPRYRLLCLSRNLTPDRSWDTMLTLEGAAATTEQPECGPLGDFVAWLATTPEHNRARMAHVARLADDVRRVAFTPPDPFKRVAFHPLGIDGYRKDPISPTRRDRLLVVSPFVESKQLATLFDGTTDSVLVTRPEEFARLDVAPDADRVPRVLRLDDALEPEPADEPHPWLEGLHAKAYVADQGWDATLWTGSANATGAAFGGNVEFMVALTGRKAGCGVDAVLGGGAAGTLLSMLVPCEPSGPLAEPDTGEQRLDAVARLVADWPITVHASQDGDRWTLSLATSSALRNSDDVDVSTRPLSTGAPLQPIGDGAYPTFHGVQAHEVSGLFVVDLRLRDIPNARRQFVVGWPLLGDVPDRVRALIRAFATDRDRVLAFIRLFLTFDEVTGPTISTPENGADGDSRSSTPNRPILEVLLRALTREPSRIADLARWIPDLAEASAGGSASDDLLEVWNPIWAAYQELGHG